MELSLKNLTTSVMWNLGDALTNPEKRRPLLAGAKELAGHLPSLERVQNGLQVARALEEKLAPHTELTAVMLDAQAVDAVHDDDVRRVDRGLDFAEMMAQTPATKALYQNLRKRLLPTGASIVNKSYREEAGQAALVDKELTADDKALMKKIQTPEGSMWTAHLSRVDSAAKLDQLEDKRVVLEAAIKNLPGSAQEVKDARNTWIRVVRQVLVAIEEDPSLTAMDRDILLKPFQEQAPSQKRATPEPAPNV